MEAKLNIAEILKNKPKGTKLYADAFGELSLERVKVNKVISIFVKTKRSISYSFYSNGSYTKEGEPILVPSKEMRDWEKFAWKKGDILVSNDNDSHIIFEEFSKDDYTIFKGKHWVGVSIRRHISCLNAQDTRDYHIEDNKNVIKTYINTIEKRLGGKLNRETLEIEKQSEFKDGDIVVTDSVSDMCYSKCIFILKGGLNACEYRANSYVFYNIDNNHISFDIVDRTIKDRNIHLATEEEKWQLFDALAKKGKAWDSKKKQIVDLKPKWTPKPFDRVITRVDDNAIWTANIFSHMDSYGEYVTIGCVGGYPYCIPYNEETAKLIGTTKEWKE